MRLLVFSRPVDLISKAFNAPNTNVTSLILDTTSEYVNHDIRCFIDTKLAALYLDEDFHRECEQMEVVDKLAQLTSGLFIWATTVCRFISDLQGGHRLNIVLRQNALTNTIQSLTTLYQTILNTIVSELQSDKVNKGRNCIMDILGAVMVARTPPGMTADLLDALVLTDMIFLLNIS